MTERQYRLGLFYEKGLGVEQNIVKAVSLYKRAANGICYEAKLKLATAFREGKGVQKNYDKAIYWFSELINQKRMLGDFGFEWTYDKPSPKKKKYDTLAQCALGDIYAEAEGFEHDISEALKWYRQAAQNKSASAQEKIAILYFEGKGVLENYQMAYSWALLASKNGRPAIKHKISSKLTKSERADAQKQAKELAKEVEGD